MSASASSCRSAPRPLTAWSASRRRSPRPGSTGRSRSTRRRCSTMLGRSRPSRSWSGSSRQRHRVSRHGVRARARAARHEGKRGGVALERVRAQPGNGLAGQVELAHGFSLVWSGPGIRTFTSTSDRPVQENEPTLFEIWVCADGYWCDYTKNVCPGKLTEDYDHLLDQLLVVYHRGPRASPGDEHRWAVRPLPVHDPRLRGRPRPGDRRLHGGRGRRRTGRGTSRRRQPRRTTRACTDCRCTRSGGPRAASSRSRL